MIARDLAKRMLRGMGFEVRRFAPASSSAAQLAAALDAHGVNLVFDVGANQGQFARELRWHVGYRGRIVSFEPLRAAHSRLSRAAAGDSLWAVAPAVALGATDGTVSINVAENSVSSSVLPMLRAHSDAAPDSRYSGTEEVEMRTFDAAAAPYIEKDSVIFLKIDTQGYESEVLQGAEKTLAGLVGVQLEVSLVPLYAGQKLMPDMIAAMESQGFLLWSMFPTFAAATGRILQMDATFFRLQQ